MKMNLDTVNTRLVRVFTCITFSLLLLSCSNSAFEQDLIKGALESASGDRIGYNQAQCNQIKLVCPARNYSEWQTSDIEFGCSCKDGQTPQR